VFGDRRLGANRLSKARRRIRAGLVQKLRGTPFYRAIYPSTWHALLRPNGLAKQSNAYFTARPHPGAGIGHQMANWIAGYWFAQVLGLRYAHSPFPSEKWERLLGFGEGEVSVEALRRDQAYRTVSLPIFDEDSVDEVMFIRRIIASYGDQRVVFVAEQDQFYRDQYGVAENLQGKFSRSGDLARPHFDPSFLNVALHVRRGDIGKTKKINNPNLAMRWQSEQYFLRILDSILQVNSDTRPIRVWLFSQGHPADFIAFTSRPNVTLCLDVDEQNTFVMMATADVLVTSRSSFSYKAALLNTGVKICPDEFWHSYPPQDPTWIIVEGQAEVSTETLCRALEASKIDLSRFSVDSSV